jgi:type VI secretion system protein VasD
MLILTGCPPPWHTHPFAEAFLRSAPTLNPDARGKARPVLIRFYLLRDDERFLGATPAGLAAKDRALLAEALIHVEEFTVAPGRSEPMRVPLGELSPEVKVVGVFAMFDGERASGEAWHVAVPVEDLDSVVIELRDRTVKILPR